MCNRMSTARPAVAFFTMLSPSYSMNSFVPSMGAIFSGAPSNSGNIFAILYLYSTTVASIIIAIFVKYAYSQHTSTDNIFVNHSISRGIDRRAFFWTFSIARSMWDYTDGYTDGLPGTFASSKSTSDTWASLAANSSMWHLHAFSTNNSSVLLRDVYYFGLTSGGHHADRTVQGNITDFLVCS